MRNKFTSVFHQLRCASQLHTSDLVSGWSSSSHHSTRCFTSATSILTSSLTPVDALLDDALPDDAELAARSEVIEPLTDPESSDEITSDSADLLGASTAGAEFRRSDAISALPPGTALHQSFDFQGKEWRLETGRLARLADGACTLRVGGTTVLATASWDPSNMKRRDARGPVLDVDYREKLYAVGRIPGTYNKREGMPKEHETLASRRIERALRPLLPRGYMHETEILANVLSADGEGDPEVLAIVAASTALMCSGIPWAGPVGAARVAVIAAGDNDNEKTVKIGPSLEDLESASLHVLVAATADRIVMLEVEGDQVSEEAVMTAVAAGVEAAREQLPAQLELARATGRKKDLIELAGADPAAARRMADAARSLIGSILRNTDLDRTSRARALEAAKASLEQAMRANGCWRAEYSRVPGSGCVSLSDLEYTFAAALEAELRALILNDGIRPDGRGCIDLRSVCFETDHVPVVHGSALVEAGETQSLCTLTVGSSSEQQRMETLLGGEDSKQLFVHYTHFPIRAGASARDRWSSTTATTIRHELDRSALIERALGPALPHTDSFPFTARLNIDALGPDGSSSMGAVAGACLAMSDANVPLRALCAGVSVGMVSNETWSGESGRAGGWPVDQPPSIMALLQSAAAAGTSSSTSENSSASASASTVYELITDPTALEASLSNAELRVAGTAQGITACQLEIKLPGGGIPIEALQVALQRAQVGRLRLLKAMEAAVPQHRHDHAPVFGNVQVPPTMVGKVIGKEGSTLREVESTTGSRVSVGTAGMLHVFSPSAPAFKQTREVLLAAVGENIKADELYVGKVVAVKEFGAFVAIPGSDVHALLHVSELEPRRVERVEDVVKVGDDVRVVCLGRDHRGTIRVSRKAALARDKAASAGTEAEK